MSNLEQLLPEIAFLNSEGIVQVGSLRGTQIKLMGRKRKKQVISERIDPPLTPAFEDSKIAELVIPYIKKNNLRSNIW